MLFQKIFDKFFEDNPKMNPILAMGYARSQSVHAMRFLDRFLGGYNDIYPEGIRYQKITMCSPEETLREITKKKYSKHTLEISKNDRYLVKIEYTYYGRPLLPIYLYLPIVGVGGITHISGTMYTICPVLSDVGVSVDGKGGRRELFFRVSKAGMSFQRLLQGFYRNGERVQVNILHSMLLNKSTRTRKGAVNHYEQPTLCDTILCFYVFSKYGFSNTLQRYCKTTPIIIERDEIDNLSEEVREKYDICQSLRLKPTGVKSKEWVAPNLCVLIKSDDFTPLVSHFIASFFYITEHYPDRFSAQDFGSESETALWALSLGKALWKNDIAEGRLLNEVDAHLASVDTYLDNISKTTLEDGGIYCENIYDLFVHMMENEIEYFVKRDMSDMSSKRLAVLGNHLMYDITSAFNQVYYDLDKRARKGVLSDKDINTIFKDRIRIDLIRALNSTKHGEARVITSPSDSLVTNFSTVLVLQAKATRQGKDKGTTIEPSQLLNSSILEFGSINHITNEFTGRDRLNLYAEIDSNGHFVRNPDLALLIEEVDRDISG
jgi:hypothetical protein